MNFHFQKLFIFILRGILLPFVLCCLAATAPNSFAQDETYFGIGTRVTIDSEGEELYDERESTSIRDGLSNPNLKRVIEIPTPGTTLIAEFDDRIIGGRQAKLYSRAQIISNIEGLGEYSVDVYNQAFLRDTMTIYPPEGTGVQNGTFGTVDITVGVGGDWLTQATPLSQRNVDNKVHVRWRVLGSVIKNGSGNIIDFGLGPSAVGGDLELWDKVDYQGKLTGTPLEGGADLSGRISFNYGEPFSLYFVITADADAYFNAPKGGAAIAEIDMRNTVSLFPFTNFMADVDGDGEYEMPLPEVVVTATSGYDYLAPLPPSLIATSTESGYELIWDEGVLESADSPINPMWSEETGATSPFPLTPTGDQKFYRLRLDN